MVGRAGKPTAGRRMGTAERNKTLPTHASLRALRVLKFGKVTDKTSISLRSNTIVCRVMLVTLAKGNSAPSYVMFDSLTLVEEALRLQLHLQLTL